MITNAKYVPTTITADFDVSVDVQIGIQEVQDWLNSASEEEIAKLDLPNGAPKGYDHAIGIDCGSDAGSLHDLQRIQEACDRLDLSEILLRLSA